MLVTSGAIAEGVNRFGWKARPVDTQHLQAAASVGQISLMKAYDTHFMRHGICPAQILLTHEDFADYQRHSNIEATLQTLLDLKVIPIINQNDSVSTDEICFGDNDMLAALVGNIVGAHRLVLLTDQEGIFTANPRECFDAQLIRAASVDEPWLLDIAGTGGEWGKGGMLGKIKAAQMFALSGGVTSIVSGRTRDCLISTHADASSIGTQLFPGTTRLVRRAQWLVGLRKTAGTIVLKNRFAAHQTDRRSIYLHHVANVSGNFESEDLVQVMDGSGKFIARGLVNYSSKELTRMALANELEEDLRFNGGSKEVVHSSNMVEIEI